MTTPGDWYYKDGHIYSTHRRDDGRPTPIATLAIGPDTEANGEFIVLAVRHLREVLAVRHLREVLALYEELTAPMESNDELPDPNA